MSIPRKVFEAQDYTDVAIWENVVLDLLSGMEKEAFYFEEILEIICGPISWMFRDYAEQALENLVNNKEIVRKEFNGLLYYIIAHNN